MSLFFLTVIVLVLSSCDVSADGLVFQAPRDGQWVQYNFADTKVNTDGTVVNTVGTLKLTALNTTETNGMSCRWIELVVLAEQKGKSFSHVVKLLVSESDLAAGKNPLQSIVKWWRQTPVTIGAPRELIFTKSQAFPTRDARFLDSLQLLLHGPSRDAKSMKAIQIDSGKNGRMHCKGVVYNRTAETAGASIASAFTVRLHDRVPFGVVTFAADRVFTRDDVISRDDLFSSPFTKPSIVRIRLTLADFGTDGKSLLPDRE